MQKNYIYILIWMRWYQEQEFPFLERELKYNVYVLYFYVFQTAVFVYLLEQIKQRISFHGFTVHFNSLSIMIQQMRFYVIKY
jgi:hypothetical protein